MEEVVLGMVNRVGCPDNKLVHVRVSWRINCHSDVISRIITICTCTQVNITSVSS